jgi:hypothetical protein
LDESIELAKREPTIRRTSLAGAMCELAILIDRKKPSKEGEDIIRRALNIGRTEQPGGSWELDPLYALQTRREQANDLRGAEDFARQEAEVMAGTAGPNHPLTAVARVGWARLAARVGEIPAAVEAVDQAMPIVLEHTPGGSPSLWISTRDAAVVMRLAHRLNDAEHYSRLSLKAAQTQHLGDSDPRLANSWQQLGNALAEEGKTSEAIRSLQQARAIYERAGREWAGTERTVAQRIAELETVDQSRQDLPKW